MAQLAKPAGDADVREYLLAEARDFRRMIVGTQLDDPQWRDYCWRETSKAVDQLAGGGECRIHRWQLPDGHPVRVVGSMSDDLVLGADDVLRVAP